MASPGDLSPPVQPSDGTGPPVPASPSEEQFHDSEEEMEGTTEEQMLNIRAQLMTLQRGMATMKEKESKDIDDLKDMIVNEQSAMRDKMSELIFENFTKHSKENMAINIETRKESENVIKESIDEMSKIAAINTSASM